MPARRRIRKLTSLFAAIAFAALPAGSQNGGPSCQGDLQWQVHYFDGILQRRLISATCVSFDCPVACTQTSVNVDGFNYTRCTCNDPSASDCCTLLWRTPPGMANSFRTTGNCTDCQETGECEVETIFIYGVASPNGSFTHICETTAICAN